MEDAGGGTLLGFFCCLVSFFVRPWGNAGEGRWIRVAPGGFRFQHTTYILRVWRDPGGVPVRMAFVVPPPVGGGPAVGLTFTGGSSRIQGAQGTVIEGPGDLYVQPDVSGTHAFAMLVYVLPPGATPHEPVQWSGLCERPPDYTFHARTCPKVARGNHLSLIYFSLNHSDLRFSGTYTPPSEQGQSSWPISCLVEQVMARPVRDNSLPQLEEKKDMKEQLVEVYDEGICQSVKKVRSGPPPKYTYPSVVEADPQRELLLLNCSRYRQELRGMQEQLKQQQDHYSNLQAELRQAQSQLEYFRQDPQHHHQSLHMRQPLMLMPPQQQGHLDQLELDTSRIRPEPVGVGPFEGDAEAGGVLGYWPARTTQDVPQTPLELSHADGSEYLQTDGNIGMPQEDGMYLEPRHLFAPQQHLDEYAPEVPLELDPNQVLLMDHSDWLRQVQLEQQQEPDLQFPQQDQQHLEHQSLLVQQPELQMLQLQRDTYATEVGADDMAGSHLGIGEVPSTWLAHPLPTVPQTPLELSYADSGAGADGHEFVIAGNKRSRPQEDELDCPPMKVAKTFPF